MRRVSSNMTLLLRIFVPTIWIVFFGLFTLAVLFANPENSPLFGRLYVKLIFVVSFLIFLGFLYLTVLKIKRVDMGPDSFQVTNYFKTFKYPYTDISSVKERDFLFFKTVVIRLKAKGSFGNKIIFVANMMRYRSFIKEFPQVFQHLA